MAVDCINFFLSLRKLSFWNLYELGNVRNTMHPILLLRSQRGCLLPIFGVLNKRLDVCECDLVDEQNSEQIFMGHFPYIFSSNIIYLYQIDK